MKKLAVLSACIVAIALVSPANAVWVPLTGAPIPISDLPGGQLVVGDKVFSDFEVVGIAEGGALTPHAGTVLVQGGQDQGGTEDYGLRFVLNWDVGSNQSVNANINFNASILPGYDCWFIEDVYMLLSIAGATGTGVVGATETVWDAPPPMATWLATLSTSWQVGATGADLSDSAVFDPIKQIHIRKGITITGGTNGTAKLNEVFQLYSQIPEPATVCLLGLGAVVLLRSRKRQ